MMDIYALFLQFEAVFAVVLFTIVVTGLYRDWNEMFLVVTGYISVILMTHNCFTKGIPGDAVLVVTVMLLAWYLAYWLSHHPSAHTHARP